MWRSASKYWQQRVRDIANALAIGERAGRSVASGIASEASPKTVRLLPHLMNAASSAGLKMHPNVSPPVWGRAIALLIGSMQPFPLKEVRAALTGISVASEEAFMLACGLIYACENDLSLVEHVTTDIAVTADTIGLDGTLDLLRFAGGRSSDMRIIDAIARGLTFHEKHIETSTMMRLEVAAALWATARASAKKYVEMAYEVITPDLVASLNPTATPDGELGTTVIILQCLHAYQGIFPERKQDAEIKRGIMLDRCSPELRSDLEQQQVLSRYYLRLFEHQEESG